MSIFSILFRQDVFKKGAEIVDEAFYTQEERAEHRDKILMIKQKFLQLYEPYKIAQRYLAIVFSIPFALLHVGAFAVRIAMWDNPELQTAIATVQDDINTSFGNIVWTIIGFYFLGGTVEGGIRAYKNDAK